MKDLDEVDIEEAEKRWQERQPHFIPNWFSVDVKTGVSESRWNALFQVKSVIGSSSPLMASKIAIKQYLSN